MAFASGICVAGKDTGDGSACTVMTSQWLQMVVEQSAQAGSPVLTVPQVQMIALAMSGDAVVAATVATQYKSWLAMAAAMGDSRFVETSPAIVIPQPAVVTPVQQGATTTPAVVNNAPIPPPKPGDLDMGFFANAVKTQGQ